MKPVVLDTNILLDIFVFNDERAIHLKQAIVNESIVAIASQKTMLEFADVIRRPLFKLDEATQVAVLSQWQSIAKQYDDSDLAPAPWICQDPDDQVFLDLAFTSKPCILISKDNEVLKFATKALKENVLITDNYNIMDLLHE